jgi:hypothetical protein
MSYSGGVLITLRSAFGTTDRRGYVHLRPIAPRLSDRVDVVLRRSTHHSSECLRHDGPEVTVTSNLLVQTKSPQNSLGNQDLHIQLVNFQRSGKTSRLHPAATTDQRCGPSLWDRHNWYGLLILQQKFTSSSKYRAGCTIILMNAETLFIFLYTQSNSTPVLRNA